MALKQTNKADRFPFKWTKERATHLCRTHIGPVNVSLYSCSCIRNSFVFLWLTVSSQLLLAYCQLSDMFTSMYSVVVDNAINLVHLERGFPINLHGELTTTVRHDCHCGENAGNCRGMSCSKQMQITILSNKQSTYKGNIWIKEMYE